MKSPVSYRKHAASPLEGPVRYFYTEIILFWEGEEGVENRAEHVSTRCG